jgi:hypothetical protein
LWWLRVNEEIVKLKELNPELFSYELYNMAGCFQIDTALHCDELFGYCDASRLLVRPKSGEYALMIEYKNGYKCWFHISERMLKLIKKRITKYGENK